MAERSTVRPQASTPRRVRRAGAIASALIGAYWFGWFIWTQVNQYRIPVRSGEGTRSVGAAIILVIGPSLICCVGGALTYRGHAGWRWPIIAVLGFYALVLASWYGGWLFAGGYVLVMASLLTPSGSVRGATSRRHMPALGVLPLAVVAVGVIVAAIR